MDGGRAPLRSNRSGMRGRNQQQRQQRRSKQKHQILALLAIALAPAIASIGFGLLHLKFNRHPSDDKSSVSFKPPAEASLADFAKRESSKTKKKKRPSLSGTTANARHHQRLHLKYDAAGPKPIPGSARSHALPNAVPFDNTIPLEHAENKSYHISQRTNTSLPLSYTDEKKARYNWNHTYHDDFRTLYLYNPSILPLHNTLPRTNESSSGQNYDLFWDDALSEQDLSALTGSDPSVRYVATFRAYLGCNCFGPNKNDRTLMTAGEQISYLAIALLDDKLDVVEGTDVLVDLNAGCSRGLYFRQFMEDCKILLMNGGLYLLCNEELKRVKITRTSPNHRNETSPPPPRKALPPPGYGTNRGIQLPYVYPNIHGDGLEITLLSHHTKISAGKNFDVFHTRSKQTNGTPENAGDEESSAASPIHEYYVQVFPSPHKYMKIYVPDGRDSRGDTKLDILRDPVSKNKTEEQTAPQSRGLPRPTFDTPDTFHNISRCPGTKEMNCTNPFDVPFFDDEDDHGTACCVRVFLPYDRDRDKNRAYNNNNNGRKGREVMVGISHQKLSARKNFWLLDVQRRYEEFGINRFVSRFVAYDTQHPFDVVTRSGWFCLGFANDPSELNHPQRNTLAGQNTNVRLDLFDDVYDCPVIHFASGFSEVVGNSSRAIIGYGVNDCHPRMFVLEKDEIVRLLTTE